MYNFHISLVYFFLYKVTANYKFSKEVSPIRHPSKYYVYENASITVASNDIIEDLFDVSKRRCTVLCDIHKECISVNLITKVNEIYSKCQLLKVTAYPDHTVNSIYITKLPKSCSGYCRTTNKDNICGKCECVEKCNSKFPYICDCRKVQELTNSCEDAVNQHNVSGIYTIKPKETSFDVLCRKQGDQIWTTYMQISKPHAAYVFDNYSAYEIFYGSFTDNFWLGLKSLYELTNTKDMVLRFEFTTELLETIILEYTGFELLDDSKYGWYYKRYRVVQQDDEIEDHMICRRGQPFIICKESKAAWWGPCDIYNNNVPLTNDEIKWNLIQQITSMKMLVRKSVSCEDMIGTYKFGDTVNDFASIIIKHKKLAGEYSPFYNKPPFYGTVADNNNGCKGNMIFPDDTTYSFEYLEIKCQIKWSDGSNWVRTKCATIKNKTTTCNSIDEDNCPTNDYYINPDGNGMVRVHCNVNLNHDHGCGL